MKEVLRQMLRIYKPFSQMDWLNYKLKKDDVTYHHIKKREDGGRKDISNGAILMPNSHSYLHLIEFLDINTYILLNEIFKDVNGQMCEPTMEQRQIIDKILADFENVHKWDKGSKGKLLVKRKYLERCRF